MAKTQPKTTKKPKPVKKSLGSKAMQAALGTEGYDIQKRRLLELIEAAYFSKGDSEEQGQAKLFSVAETIENLAPRGELERMLVWQMVATYGHSMECLRRAIITGQSFEGRDNNLKHAEKLTALIHKATRNTEQASWQGSAEYHGKAC